MNTTIGEMSIIPMLGMIRRTGPIAGAVSWYTIDAIDADDVPGCRGDQDRKTRAIRTMY